MDLLIFGLLAVSVLIEITFSTIFSQLYLQRKKIVYLYFAIFTGIAIFWSLGTALMLFSRSVDLVVIGYWLFLIAPMLSTLFILFFCQQFTRGKVNYKYALGVIFIVAYALFLALTGRLISINFVQDGLNAVYPNQIFYIFYGLFFVIYFDISIFILRQHRQDKDRIKYYQAKSIVYGTGLTGSLGILTNIVMPAFGITRWIWLGPSFSLIFLGFATVAIAKYKFLDIKAVVLRSTTYIFTVSILAAIYSVLVVVILGQTVLNQTINLAQWLLLSFATALVVTSFTPLQKFFNKYSNRLFYRDAYDSQQLLSELNTILIGNLEVKGLLEQSSKVINDFIKAEFCLFDIYNKNLSERIIGIQKESLKEKNLKGVEKLIKTNKKIVTYNDLDDSTPLKNFFSKHNIALLVRLDSKTGRESAGLGYILFGQKKSGGPFSNQDVKAIEIIADEMVIAIQNALRFEEIQNFTVTLQQKVDDATHKLRKANEKLVALDQTKDDFISMASHQLRTPLTSVKGYVSMVLEGDAGKVNEKQKELLNQSFVSSQRMVYLIADLLNVSRLRTGKFIIDPKPTNLADVVEGEISQLQETAEGRGLKLTYDKPKDFPVLMLDETKTRQVIMNFADNAIYYTPSGGHIKVVLEDKAQSIEFRVEDDGIGVPKNEQHHMFSKFYRAGNAKKARPDGTGLGLFMAKKVIVAQKGSIIFKSKEGEGSTFGFSFEKKPLLPENFKGFVKEEDDQTAHSPKKVVSKTKKADAKSK